MVSATGATVSGRVTTGQATFHFEYGTSTDYGQATPETAPARFVSRRLSNLLPHTTYHYRVVATNAGGVSRGDDRTFITPNMPWGVMLAAPVPALVAWGGSVTVNGRLTGLGVDGAEVILKRQDFPYRALPYEAARGTAGPDGSFSFRVGPLWARARLQAVAGSWNFSQTVLVRSRANVGLRVTGRGARSVSFTGAIRPAVPNAIVSVQRRIAGGRWTPVRRVGVTPLTGNRSRYVVTLARPRRATKFRVVVVPNDHRAHDRGVSRTVTVRP